MNFVKTQNKDVCQIVKNEIFNNCLAKDNQGKGDDRIDGNFLSESCEGVIGLRLIDGNRVVHVEFKRLDPSHGGDVTGGKKIEAIKKALIGPFCFKCGKRLRS